MKPNSLPISKIAAFAFAECRGAWRRFLFFIICLSIGVGAVMTIDSFSRILNKTIFQEAKALLAADLEIKSSWEQTSEDLKIVQQTLPPGSDWLFIKELKGMARFPQTNQTSPKDKKLSFLVEIKAVPAKPPYYPFYGKINAQPKQPLNELLLNQGALVEKSFLVRSQLNIGDSFKLGSATINIAGEIISEPDRITRSFSVGPRVLISLNTLETTKLVRPGSRVSHKTAIKLPEGAPLKETADALEEKLTDQTAVVKTFRNTQSSLTSSITQMSEYLSCVGIIALLLGGMGVAMISRTFLSRKLDTIAILNCLGATPRSIFKVYILQAFFLGIIGGILGITLGYAAQFLLPPRLEGLLTVGLNIEFMWVPALRAFALGLLIAILFVLGPLLKAVQTKPIRLFRHVADDEAQEKGSRRQAWTLRAIFSITLIPTIFWQAGSLKKGLFFIVAAGLAFLLFNVLSKVFLKALNRFSQKGSPAQKFGLSNLYRPNSQANAIISSLGIGIMLILTLRLVQLDMITMLNKDSNVNPPNYFFIDIQPDQEETFLNTINKITPGAESTITPLVRSRFYQIGDKTVDDWEFKTHQEERWIKREFVLTYSKGELPKDNEIIEGKWWSEAEASTPQVSLESDAAARFGAKIGSTLTMDIQGIKISAPVTSIRKVNWRNMRTNFYVIFSPGALEGAPISMVATVHVKKEQETPLQQAVAEALPNVTAISTRDIVETVEDVANKLMALVDFMSAFSILAGLFILSGAIASTKFRRLKEAAILKILGFKRFKVAAILGYEYAGLGFISAFIASVLATALSWGVMKYLVKAPWSFYPFHIGFAFLAAVFLTSITGVISSLDILNNKPFQTLRQADR